MWDRSRPLRPFAVRIALNLVTDHLRRGGRFEEHLREAGRAASSAQAASPARALDQAEQVDLLRACVLRLPEPERTVLLLWSGGLGDQTLEEVAEHLGFPLARVWRIKEKAMNRLKAFLEEHIRP